MCGIAGIVKFNNQQVLLEELKGMTNSMIHRGPDDDGFFIENSFGISMRRLSIIDVKGGQQPLTNEKGNIHLVLNGEIYNFLELRTQLKNRGHVFKTGSDAEVLIHLYEEKGQKAIHDLNGMFAFALYDSLKKILWIGRDRLGIKPFYYVLNKDYFVFSSDIKSIRKFHNSSIEHNQVLKYLSLAYSPENNTVWKDIKKLKPAENATIDSLGFVKIDTYWNIESFERWQGNLNEAKDNLIELFNDSVKLQLRTDVPLGVFLSGGLDSSAIVASASKQLNNPLKTLTVDFEGKKNSKDAFYAKKVSEIYKTEHFNFSMSSKDVISTLDELLKIIDEPLGDSAMLPTYILSKYARGEGIKVILNGAGGDEIFGGYSRHWSPKIASPAWISENTNGFLRKSISNIWSLFQPARGLRASDPRLSWGISISGADLSALKNISNDLSNYNTLLKAMFDEHCDLTNNINQINSYAYKRMYMDLKKYLPDNILSLCDKATMASSVEGRVPFLDHRLVEFAFSLPSKYNLIGNTQKGLFKEINKNLLPQGLLNRAKEGFNPPDIGWFGDLLNHKLKEELLENTSSVILDLFDKRKLEKLLSNKNNRRNAAGTLYSLFLFNKWFNNQ